MPGIENRYAKSALVAYRQKVLLSNLTSKKDHYNDSVFFHKRWRPAQFNNYPLKSLKYIKVVLEFKPGAISLVHQLIKQLHGIQKLTKLTIVIHGNPPLTVILNICKWLQQNKGVTNLAVTFYDYSLKANEVSELFTALKGLPRLLNLGLHFRIDNSGNNNLRPVGQAVRKLLHLRAFVFAFFGANNIATERGYYGLLKYMSRLPLTHLILENHEEKKIIWQEPPTFQLANVTKLTCLSLAFPAYSTSLMCRNLLSQLPLLTNLTTLTLKFWRESEVDHQALCQLPAIMRQLPKLKFFHFDAYNKFSQVDMNYLSQSLLTPKLSGLQLRLHDLKNLNDKSLDILSQGLEAQTELKVLDIDLRYNYNLSSKQKDKFCKKRFKLPDSARVRIQQ